MPRHLSLFLHLSNVALGAALLSGCGPRGETNPGSHPSPKHTPRIVGTVVEESLARKRMRIWGRVQRIMENEHGKLPEATAVSKQGMGDPVAKIKNVTPFLLTLWFSGPCPHETNVLPGRAITAVFCPGKYHIAAIVNNKDYMPLVREDQHFRGGRIYVLQIVIKRRPR